MSHVSSITTLFGLDVTSSSTRPPVAPPPPAGITEPGHITLLLGPSGGGKSSLLRQWRETLHPQTSWINLDTLHPQDDRPIVDCFPALCLHQTLSLLAKVGLAEAWTYLRTPAQLSAGQSWRFRLASGLYGAQRAAGASGSSAAHISLLACDEFAAVLDRVTACAVAQGLRRLLDRADPRSPAAIVATSHDDLICALRPDLIVHCDFGRYRVEIPP